MKTRKTVIVTIACALALLGPPTVDAQLKDWVKDAAKDTVRSEGRRQVDRGIRHAIRCAVGEYECYERAKQRGEEVVFVDESGEVITDAQGDPVTDPANLPPQHRPDAPEAPAAAAATVNASYDFQPGERVILYEDYSRDNMGDFPRRLEFRKGNIAVVELNGRRVLQVEGKGEFDIPLPERLPDQFTIEFDAQIQRHQFLLFGSPVGEISIEVGDHPYHRFQVSSDGGGTGITAGNVVNAPQAMVTGLRDFSEQMVPIRVMVDGRHAKMYVGTNRVANLPSGTFARGDSIRMHLERDWNQVTLLGPIRIAAGGRDLYDALANEGRVAIHDILFDTDQATIKPQSAEVLTGIGAMLTEHREISLMIEGHTDSTGDFDHNMDLSQRRAESVRQWLVTNHGIAEDRLRSMGLGSTQPKESNDTDEGRRQNRRVELVKTAG